MTTPPSSRRGRRTTDSPVRAAGDRGRTLSLTEVALLLRADTSRVRAWARHGDVASTTTTAGHVRIEPDDLVRFLESRRAPVPDGLRALVRRRVLVIEDDATQRGALSRAFAGYRDRVAAAFEPGAFGGLLRAAAWRPHVLVVDVYRPGIDGVEVCRRLQRYPETASTVVVLVSARLTPELVATGAQAGAARVVAKPVSVAELVELALACPALPERAP
jgi:CheY-like chemotaxis protein